MPETNAVRAYYKSQLEEIGYGQPGGTPAGTTIDMSVADQLSDDSDELSDAPDDEGEGEYEPPAAEDLVANALGDPEAFAAVNGQDAEDWLRWATSASPAEWARASAEAGMPGAQQPRLYDLPDAYRIQFEQERLDQRVADGRGQFGWDDR